MSGRHPVGIPKPSCVTWDGHFGGAVARRHRNDGPLDRPDPDIALHMILHAGCQGWSYEDWVTKPGDDHVFFPEGTVQKETLRLYSEVFRTVEVDSTFYATPSEDSVLSWHARSADDFRFSLKLPREITHDHRLGPASYGPLDEFCRRARLLKEKLALVLVQLPPSFAPQRKNARNLREFLKRLPGDIRFAVEFRDPGWLVDWTMDELGSRNVSLCAVEGKWIPREAIFAAIRRGADLPLYVRFMGPRDLVKFDRVRRPKDREIEIWHRELDQSGREIFAYFNNLFEGYAPASVNKLLALNGEPQADPSVLRTQGSLF